MDAPERVEPCLLREPPCRLNPKDEKIVLAGLSSESEVPIGGWPSGFGRMFNYFRFHETELMRHYHQRSNAETAMMIIKAKFGTRLRSKTPSASANEILFKVLAHNICRLNQAIQEWGIDPSFEHLTVKSRRNRRRFAPINDR